MGAGESTAAADAALFRLNFEVLSSGNTYEAEEEMEAVEDEAAEPGSPSPEMMPLMRDECGVEEVDSARFTTDAADAAGFSLENMCGLEVVIVASNVEALFRSAEAVLCFSAR